MRPLLFASVLIVLVFTAAPALVTRYLEHSAQAEAAQPAPEDAPAASEPFPSRSIRAESDGHFYVEARINLRPVRMMVDTGATVVALRRSDAASAGIRVRDADFLHQVQTANGLTKAAEAILDNIIVADIEVGGVRALVLPDDQLSISLLGGSFLGKLARYEVRDGTLIFEN